MRLFKPDFTQFQFFLNNSTRVNQLLEINMQFIDLFGFVYLVSASLLRVYKILIRRDLLILNCGVVRSAFNICVYKLFFRRFFIVYTILTAFVSFVVYQG